MQDSKKLISEGRLSEAIEGMTARVKADPANTSARLGLFEMLCFQGDLDRASKQLDVVGNTESMEFAYAVTILKKNLIAEGDRRKVLAGEMKPEFLGDDHVWAVPLLDILREGGQANADVLDSSRPRPSGSLNDEKFADLREGDDLLARVFEVFVSGRYVWLAWSQIAKLTAAPPKTLRDTMWQPVELELSSGDRCDGIMPVLYCGSHAAEDESLRLGLATDWVEENGMIRGVGRRVIYANGAEQDLLGIRELSVEA